MTNDAGVPVRLSEITDALEGWYPSRFAEPWDRVGLVAGDPEQAVVSILLTVDPTASVVNEAINQNVDLVIAHHPLLLSPVHSVARNTAAGAVLHPLIQCGTALFTAHTNADSAADGVAQAAAAAFGLQDLRPLVPGAGQALDKIVVTVPASHAEAVVDAMAHAGAGTLGEYSRCAWKTTGTGTFEPSANAQPALGKPGHRETIAEERIEMVLRRELRSAVLAAARGAHPYEEPAIDVFELATGAAATGLGRIGTLPEPVSLAEFASQVADALPGTAAGVRIAGNLEKRVTKIAVLPGSGSSILAAAQASGADAFVTSDLKHHQVLDALSASDMGIIDTSHWAIESLWLAGAARRLQETFAGLRVQVSGHTTDPWSGHLY